MFVLEYKIKAKQRQFQAIDEAILAGQFVRNKALRYWMDNKGVNIINTTLINIVAF